MKDARANKAPAKYAKQQSCSELYRQGAAMLYHSTEEVTRTAGKLKTTTTALLCTAQSTQQHCQNGCQINVSVLKTRQEDTFTSTTPCSTMYTSITTVNQSALHTCPRDQPKTDYTQTSSPTTALQAATSVEVTDLFVDHDIMRLFRHCLRSTGSILGSP